MMWSVLGLVLWFHCFPKEVSLNFSFILLRRFVRFFVDLLRKNKKKKNEASWIWIFTTVVSKGRG